MLLAITLPVWLAYLLIPVSSALVGYITNVMAIKMTFYPLEFRGIGKLGWQGIIPSKAAKVAGKAVDLITTKLVTMEDRFSQIDPQKVSEEMEPVVEKLTRRIVNDVMNFTEPELWRALPKATKQRLYARVLKDMPATVEGLMDDMKKDITNLYDVRQHVIDALVSDKKFLNEIFLKLGEKEFPFLERSGLYFGFLFGLIQMILWYFLQVSFILPLFGLIIGWATNWLAIKLIFHPYKPKKIGPFTIQGMFIKRQVEVSNAYSDLIANRILTAEKIFHRILKFDGGDRLGEMISHHVRQTVDQAAGSVKPLVQLFAGSKKYQRVKDVAAERFIEEFPYSIKHIFEYAEDAMQIEETLKQKMLAMPPEDYVGLLRPAYQEDEWILITVGAVLGALAGLGQLFILF